MSPKTRPLRLPEDLGKLVDLSKVHPPKDLTVACYTYPGFHRSAFADSLFSPGWTEYVFMRGCRPWFAGHHQPRQPLLGALDERLPSTWEIYNRLARDHGIDVLIWDSYWYNDGPALHEALDEGFLRASNTNDVRFAMMWTNHTWPIWFPNVETDDNGYIEYVLASPDKDPETIWRSMTYMVARYCHLPNYWRIEGRPVFVIWDVDRLLRILGKEGCAQLLSELRALARKMGHPGLFLHAALLTASNAPILKSLGFDSTGWYNPLQPAARRMPGNDRLFDFGEVAAKVLQEDLGPTAPESSVPFLPAVSPGWDSSARRLDRGPEWKAPAGTVAGREVIVVNETPAAFKAFVQGALAYLNEHPSVPPILTIQCWNEWTEGHYMLPDTRLGYGMLRALGEALGKPKLTQPQVRRYVGSLRRLDLSKEHFEEGQVAGAEGEAPADRT